MKIIYNNTTFYIHWPKHFDTIIISAAKRNKFKKSNFINWEQAEANGHLKGLPTLLSLHLVSYNSPPYSSIISLILPACPKNGRVTG
jgi:hypothetical protein